jgi:heterodisulfide reductase subunit B
MRQLAPIRTLIRAQESGSKGIVTLCSMCFSTLKRSGRFVEEDPSRLEKINDFMDEEPDYRGRVQVKHLMELLRDQIGWERIEAAVRRPLEGLSVAPYYGCMLLRPREIGIDDPEAPQVLHGLIEALWATPISFPFQAECCGSYQSVDQRELVAERTQRILQSAQGAGAELILTSCPLCHYNLADTQKDLVGAVPGFQTMPILYFTQLLALALEVEAGDLPGGFGATLEGARVGATREGNHG